MNLSNIAASVIVSVNPFITGTVSQSTGYTTDATYTQVPTYAPPVTAQLQVQALQYNDIAQLDGLNIQGERRKIYLNGNWDGLVRPDGKGGDLIAFPEDPGGPSRNWLVVCVLEHWPDWTSVAVTLQDS